MKIGDRVRIDCPGGTLHGKEATIWKINPYPNWGPGAIKFGVSENEPAYQLNIDGLGTQWPNGAYFSAPKRMLKPIQPLGSWEELSQIIGKDIRNPIVSV